MLKVVSRASLCLALLWAVDASAAGAQPPAQPAAQPGVEPPPATGETLSLLEAARLTLAHQPGIRLSEQDTAFEAGVLLEQTGRFDRLLAGEVSFRYDKRALRQAQIKNEVDKRDAYREAIQQLEEQLAEAEQGREEILRYQNGETTIPLSDLDLETALDLIAAELEDVRDPAVRRQLLELRARTIQKALDQYGEAITQLRGSLTENRARLAALGPVPQEEELYHGRSLVQYVFPLRNGFTIAPYFEYTLDGDRYVDKPVDDRRGGKGIPDAYRASLGFTLDVPLGRGFGAVSAAAGEASARAEYEGRLALASHVAASSLTTTAIAYWDAVAAAERLKILEASVATQGQLVDIVKAHVSAGELPSFEQARAEAQRASAQAALDQGRRSELAARISLAQAIGLNVRNAEPPRPGDPLPDLTGLEIPEPAVLAGGAEEVLAARQDLAAARKFLEAAGITVRAAVHDLRPRVDLSARAFANSFAEVSGSEAFTGRWVAPSYDLNLFVERPFGNRTQRGRLAQAEASEALRTIELNEQERVVLSDLVEFAGGLRASQAEVRAAQGATEGYRTAVEAEIKKLRGGESSFVDVLLTEQRLTEARLALVDASHDAATLLAELRLATGTLVSGEGDSRSLAPDAFTSLPQATTPSGELP